MKILRITEDFFPLFLNIGYFVVRKQTFGYFYDVIYKWINNCSFKGSSIIILHKVINFSYF